MEEEFEIVDTSKLQLVSLKNFMSALGYQYYGVDRVFISDLWSNRSRVAVGFNTAVLAHNGMFTETHGRGFEPDTVFGIFPMLCGKKLKQIRLSMRSTFRSLTSEASSAQNIL